MACINHRLCLQVVSYSFIFYVTADAIHLTVHFKHCNWLNTHYAHVKHRIASERSCLVEYIKSTDMCWNVSSHFSISNFRGLVLNTKDSNRSMIGTDMNACV